MPRVATIEHLSPNMIRVRFGGDELRDFESAGADDHVNLFVADGDGEAARDYTPRAFDTAAGTLTVNFAIHEAGPATRWAVGARVVRARRATIKN
jgi:NADPH-dependent ferric siderophore reductase